MEKIRGVFMLGAAAIAGWKAWQIPHGTQHWLALGLLGLALVMAVWHLTRPTQPRKPR